jgi:thiol:disulfide interchange protein/DsbC/DsbD-like thiol-disulfide interchange protein
MMQQVWLSRLISFLVCVMSMCGFAASATAQPRAFVPEINIVPTLEAETAAPAPGTTIMLAIAMKPKPGWHGYWVNGGDAGLKPEMKWTLPQGFSAGAMRFPVPERLVLFDLMNHVYEGPHAFLVPLTVPNDAQRGAAIQIRLNAFYLACTDKVCLPQEAQLRLDLKVGGGDIAPENRAKFDAWRMKLPRPIGSDVLFTTDKKSVRLAIPYPAGQPLKDIWFFNEIDNFTSYMAPQKIEQQGDRLILELARGGDEMPARLTGILSIGKDTGFAISAQPGQVPEFSNPQIVSAKRGSVASVEAKDGTPPAQTMSTLIYALAGALLGGLLLNVMPCVFPIISLKAMSLARAGGHERDARRDAIFYSAGTISMCLALGSALIALRSGGAAIGWAFQLQDPRVILVLQVLVTAITLNFLGVFQLRSFGAGDGLTGQGGSAGAFWTGALAAFVATPCTGPFMAAALGAALVLPAWAALAIFAGLGVGLALPFLLIGFIPALRSKLPRPGPWMRRFQMWMALPMALTAVALAWLLWRQTGGLGLGYAIAATIVTTLALALLGQRQARSLGMGKGVPFALAGVAMALAAAFLLIPLTTERTAGIAGAVPFSEARLTDLRREGRSVFLYFTADWCVTCKINEKAAIDRQEVASAFAAKGVTVMVGDWTTPDPAISRFLDSQGRSGIPLYLVYRSGGASPEILPQILTPTMLSRAF